MDSTVTKEPVEALQQLDLIDKAEQSLPVCGPLIMSEGTEDLELIEVDTDTETRESPFKSVEQPAEEKSDTKLEQTEENVHIEKISENGQTEPVTAVSEKEEEQPGSADLNCDQSQESQERIEDSQSTQPYTLDTGNIQYSKGDFYSEDDDDDDADSDVDVDVSKESDEDMEIMGNNSSTKKGSAKSEEMEIMGNHGSTKKGSAKSEEISDNSSDGNGRKKEPWQTVGKKKKWKQNPSAKKQTKITNFLSKSPVKNKKAQRREEAMAAEEEEEVVEDEKEPPPKFRMQKRLSDRDTEQYRLGYPGKKDDPEVTANRDFYMGKIQSSPDGAFIDDFHKEWKGHYPRLERHHGYIQWLFPIRESGMNWQAEPLQLHEAEAIKGNRKASRRVLESYKLMLDFYGMRLVDEETGELERNDNWEERYENLNWSSHNYLRITRILKSLGELGYEQLKEEFLLFVLKEAFEEKVLTRVQNSCQDYWIGTVKDDAARERLYKYIEDHKRKK